MMGEGNMLFGGGFMWIFWIVITIVLVVVIKAFLNTGSESKSSQSESPLEILKKHHARGEINEDEYEHQRKELER